VAILHAAALRRRVRAGRVAAVVTRGTSGYSPRQQPHNRRGAMSVEQRNKALVRGFFAAMNAADSAAIVDAYAEDGAVWTSGRTLISGTFAKAQIREASGRIFEAFPHGIEFTIHGITAEGERVAVEAESRGMHVSGKLYNNLYHFLFQFRDGKLVRLKEYMDTELVTEILCGGQRPPPA
jgi:hypothetical protein